MWDDAPDYGSQLRLAVEGYSGKRMNAIRRAPDVYDFFARLMVADLQRHEKTLVSAVIAYFVAPGDLIPEEEVGPLGLIDNLFVAAHAYKALQTSLSLHTLDAAWEGEDDLDSAMREVYSESRAELGKRRKDVLRLAGLD